MLNLSLASVSFFALLRVVVALHIPDMRGLPRLALQKKSTLSNSNSQLCQDTKDKRTGEKDESKINLLYP
jgi:hypothetical protein